MKKILSKEELGEELCNFCPLEDNLKGVHYYGDNPIFCEDYGTCTIAYQNYLDSIEENID